jgi:hypothetical protein
MTEQLETAATHIHFAISALEQALAGEPTVGNVVGNVSKALQAMRYAATSANPAPDIAELEPQLSRLFLAVAPLVNELTPVSEDLVAIGLGSASCLASKDDGLLVERYSFCVVLLGELEIFMHRQQLQRRGNQLLRYIQVRQALNTPYDPSIPLQ